MGIEPTTSRFYSHTSCRCAATSLMYFSLINYYFYNQQNLAEAEYVVAVFMYMRLIGWPAEKISILTTYNGQKHLIRDVIAKRCAGNPLIGYPHKVSFFICIFLLMYFLTFLKWKKEKTHCYRKIKNFIFLLV